MKENWNISGLIIDGICATGKTTLLHNILQSHRFTQRTSLSSLVLSEHQTQRVLEEKEQEGSLCRHDNIALLDSHVSYVELLHARLAQMPWRQNKRTNMRLCYVWERFHFTHVGHYSCMDWDLVQPIDARLAQLNCKLCLLTIDESKMEERIILNRNEAWRGYLKRFGRSHAAIVRHYAQQQNRLIGLCAKSQLKTLVVNTSVWREAEVLESVLDFWDTI